MRRIDWLAVAIAILALGPLAGCAAQADLERTAPAQTVTAPRVPGAIERALFAPELALAHADAIALSEPQRAQIVLTSRTTSASLALLDGQLDTVTAALADRLA